MVSPVSSPSRKDLSADLSQSYICRLFALSCKSLPNSVHFISSGKKRKIQSISSDFASPYEGVLELKNIQLRLMAAQSYNSAVNEKELMKNLIIHREIIYIYSKLLEECHVDAICGSKVAYFLQSFVESAEEEGRQTGTRVLSKLKKQIHRMECGSLQCAEVIPFLKLYKKHFNSKRKTVEMLAENLSFIVSDSRVKLESLILRLQMHLDRLSEFGAPDVLYDGQGRSFFCLPGGVSNEEESHITLYEFVKELNGTYSFLIYNKGDGSEDTDLHGKVVFSRGDLTIARTRVQICGLRKEHLQGKRFLRMLIKEKMVVGKSMKELNLEIKSYLLDACKGYVRTSPFEEEWVALSEVRRASWRERVRKIQIEEQLLQDPDFHSLQQWGTCGESNLQTSEHFIIPTHLRKKLKLHEIDHTIELLGDEILKHPELERFARLKIKRLKSKIAFF